MNTIISKDNNLLEQSLLSQEKKKETILKGDYSLNVIENHSMSFLAEIE